MQILPPAGRLTLVAAHPLMTADVTSQTLWYAPYDSGNSYPNLDGSLTWQNVVYTASPTDQVGASISCAGLVAGNSYDVFGLANGSIGFGPAWTASDDASRGLIRYGGIKVNSAPLTVSGASVPQYQATWLGSVHCSVSGQLTAHFNYGQDRKFEVWTAYAQNQVDIVLHVGETLNSGVFVPTNSYQGHNFLPFNGDATNRANVFTGAPTLVDVTYHQNMFINSAVAGPSGAIAEIEWNGLPVGFQECFSSDTATMESTTSGAARYMNSCALGLNIATMTVACANHPTSTVFSGVAGVTNEYAEANQVMLVRYRG